MCAFRAARRPAARRAGTAASGTARGGCVSWIVDKNCSRGLMPLTWPRGASRRAWCDAVRRLQPASGIARTSIVPNRSTDLVLERGVLELAGSVADRAGLASRARLRLDVGLGGAPVVARAAHDAPRERR